MRFEDATSLGDQTNNDEDYADNEVVNSGKNPKGFSPIKVRDDQEANNRYAEVTTSEDLNVHPKERGKSS